VQGEPLKPAVKTGAKHLRLLSFYEHAGSMSRASLLSEHETKSPTL